MATTRVFSLRRAFRLLVFIFGLFLAVKLIGDFPLMGRAGAASVELPNRPNIVFILADDLDYRAAMLMPQLRELLTNHGASFSNFFVTNSVCCPSRASILRGQYPHNHQVLLNQAPLGGFGRFYSLGHEKSTVATWLREAGYRTVLLGKYLNGYPDEGADKSYVPPGWNEWYSPAGGRPYSNFNYTMNENGKIVSYGDRPEDYMTDVLARKAVDFIRRSAKEGRPFFVYLSTFAPHSPATPAPRHQHAFADAVLPRSPSFDEEDVSDKPRWVQRQARLGPAILKRAQRLYRARLQSLLAVDEMIAQVIGTLRETGTLDGTYVFFTSDNGFHLGEHRLPEGKRTAYEEDIRVPMMVRGPGIPEGRIVEEIALNNDLAPTIAQFAGVATPNFVDGRSLTSLLHKDFSPPQTWRRGFLVERYWPGKTKTFESFEGPTDFRYHALRTKDFLYVEYTTGERELYDLTLDPHQMQSRHGIEDAAFVKKLSSHLATLRACAGESCRAAEDTPVVR